MKNIIIVLGLISFSISTYAQKRSDFKGPAYKNYKYWKHTSEPVVVYTNTIKNNLKGPAFKNYKPWQNKNNNKAKKVVLFTSNRKNLMGPAYKNYKPWQRKNR